MTLNPHVHDDGTSRLAAYDHGAHLATWEVEGQPVLWLSPAAVLDGSVAIRGGVPICFPWFAGGPDGQHSPSHGVVRTSRWRQVPTRGEEVWAWELSHTDVTGAPGARQIPGPFHLRYAVRLSPAGHGVSPTLELELAVRNTGADDYEVEAALHTYLAVGDVEQVRVAGLDAAPYLDKVRGTQEHQQGDVRLTEETDRVYDRSAPVRVHDPARRRVLDLTPHGATQTVVWNPWAQGAAATADLAADSWRGFVCVETAATGEHALAVVAGQTRTLGCVLTARPVGPM